jgi:hypothetical protein
MINIKPPKNGIYSDKELIEALNLVANNLNNFIPNHVVNGSIKGTLPRLVAKASMLVNLAKNVELAAKAIEKGQK